MNDIEQQALASLTRRKHFLQDRIANAQHEQRHPESPAGLDLLDVAEARIEHSQFHLLEELARKELAEIDAALERVRARVYGRCEGCGCLVGRQRLLAVPEARRCLACESPAASVHR
jgi:RNA polymerase-binding transcription factor DksA